jgi:phage gp36-like protein
MAVEYPYTTESLIVTRLGQLGVDLRLDDSADAESDLEQVIDDATWEVDYYLQDRYLQSDASANGWVQAHATAFAVLFLCQRRGNDPPESLVKECERRSKQLENVRKRQAHVPRLAQARRPAVVTGYSVDLRRFNNQVRVDRSKSTGVAKDYRRATDDAAPDQR